MRGPFLICNIDETTRTESDRYGRPDEKAYRLQNNSLPSTQPTIFSTFAPGIQRGLRYLIDSRIVPMPYLQVRDRLRTSHPQVELRFKDLGLIYLCQIAERHAENLATLNTALSLLVTASSTANYRTYHKSSVPSYAEYIK